jgi:hypothetical protein
MVHPNSRLPFHLDIRDVNFKRDMHLWAFQTQSEIISLVLATRKMIDATRVMIAEADRILAGK